MREAARAGMSVAATLMASPAAVPMTAVDVLHDRVLPFYDEHGVDIEHLLTDNGREYCGRPLQHAYQLFLAISRSSTDAPTSDRWKPTASASASLAR
jgi:hypothetical protein